MANPILQMLNPVQAPAQSSPLGMLQQFQQFRQQMAGRNPQQVVNELVQTGRMSPQQLQQLEQQAQGIMSMLHR